jgi:hypothetical protein
MTRRLMAVFSAIVACIGIAFIAVSPANATAYYEMVLTSTTGTPTGYCIWDQGGISHNGEPLEMHTCNTNDGTEGWVAVQSSYGAHWLQIENQYNGLCLGDYNGGGDSTSVVLWTCNGGRDQALCANEYNGFGWPVAWVFATGYAIGAKDDLAANDNGVVVWSVNGSNSEAWNGPNTGDEFDC